MLYDARIWVLAPRADITNRARAVAFFAISSAGGSTYYYRAKPRAKCSFRVFLGLESGAAGEMCDSGKACMRCPCSARIAEESGAFASEEAGRRLLLVAHLLYFDSGRFEAPEIGLGDLFAPFVVEGARFTLGGGGSSRAGAAGDGPGAGFEQAEWHGRAGRAWRARPRATGSNDFRREVMERANRNRVTASRSQRLLDAEPEESVESVLQIAAQAGGAPRAALSEARALQPSLNSRRRARSRADEDALNQFDVEDT
ncbi:unnamed protein product, partial [Prorocentrum cordatum]